MKGNILMLQAQETLYSVGDEIHDLTATDINVLIYIVLTHILLNWMLWTLFSRPAALHE
jgi:hypothetical protein